MCWLSFVDKPLAISSAVALGTTLLIGKPYIQYLQQQMMGQSIREDGPQSHLQKAGTPTMGGLLIFAGALAGLLCWGLLTQWQQATSEFWLVIGVGMVLAALGFGDDIIKITKKHNKGVTGYTKLAVQMGVSLAVGFFVVVYQNRTDVSLLNGHYLNLGMLYPLVALFVVTGASNAVNLTDGLDGLAGSTLVVALVSSALVLNYTSHPELSALCFILTAGCLGFLWFNRHPAKIFMGDTGSLALGGMLGAMMALGGAEFWLTFTGMIFILETLSVILQVASFKGTGKRIFKMAPLHHHFELCGLHETQVVFRFTLVQVVACATGLWLLFTWG